MCERNRTLSCLPAVVIPDHIKILAVEDAERFAGVQDLDRSVASVDFEIVPHAIAPLRFGVAIEDGINVVEDLAVKRRTQQLEVLSVRLHQRHGRTPRVGPETGRAPAGQPRPTPAPAPCGSSRSSSHRPRSEERRRFRQPARSVHACRPRLAKLGPVTNSLNLGPEASDVYWLGLLLVDRASECLRLQLGPTVHGNTGSSNPAGTIGGEECDYIGDIIWFTDSLERLHVEYEIAARFRLSEIRHIGLDHARCNRIHTDTPRPQQGGPLFHEGL